MAKEIWKDIIGFEGCYQVSNSGQVRSVDRVVKRLNSHGFLSEFRHKGRILHRSKRGGVNKDSLSVHMTGNGKDEQRLVKHLVIEAFTDIKPGRGDGSGVYVTPKDGDEGNCHLANLVVTSAPRQAR